MPIWADGPGFVSLTRTADELSIVCASDRVPAGVTAEPGWRALKLHGPFPLTQTGVLAAILAPLAAARVPIFALATFDTDYVLVPEARLDDALRALRSAGHEIG